MAHPKQLVASPLPPTTISNIWPGLTFSVAVASPPSPPAATALPPPAAPNRSNVTRLTPFGTVQEYVPDAFAWNRIFSGLLALAEAPPNANAATTNANKYSSAFLT